MKKTSNLSLALFVAAVLSLGCRIAFADTYETFNLAWSGAPFQNSAAATGIAVIDTTVLPDYTSGYVDENPSTIFQSLSITVTGAGAGDGAFTLSDFTGTNNMFWDTNGGTLNFSAPLIGQPTSGAPWGTMRSGNADAGDFNLFSNGINPAAPTGKGDFTLGTDGGNGDYIQLTEFSPAAATPEPSSLLLLGSGITGLAGIARRRFSRQA